MTPEFANQLALVEGALQSAVEDLSVQLLTGGEDVQRLIRRARDLADLLTEKVEQLDEEEQRPVMQHAAALAAALATLEREAAGTHTH